MTFSVNSYTTLGSLAADIGEQSVSFEASSKTTLYCVLLIIEYNIIPSAEFYGYDFGYIVEGTTSRIVNYALGFVGSVFGLILISTAIYSLATYSSAVEIERYEKKIAEYTEKSNKETAEKKKT